MSRPTTTTTISPATKKAPLHRLIYFSAAAGVIHYIWLVKPVLRKPMEYAFALRALLLCRVAAWLRSQASRRTKTWLAVDARFH
jgi:DMSO/TMAO reductase YedYZ heme-binding membrane subunit